MKAAPWESVRGAVGGRSEIRAKLARIWRTAALRLNRKEIDRRLQRLHDIGLVEKIPSRLQLFFGGSDMLRFAILPAARDYYELCGIRFELQYFLRFLEDPVSMIDPVGFFSERDAIIGHLLQSVHLNPIYDLQLLQMFDDALDELERQAQAMVDGTHPRRRTIAVTVEDPGYHERLLRYVRAYRENPDAPPPIREDGGLRQDPDFRLAETMFHTLPAFMRYSARLPDSLPRLLVHRLTTRKIDPRYCDQRERRDESMKMEMPLESPLAGTVREIRIKENEAVNEGAVLIVLD